MLGAIFEVLELCWVYSIYSRHLKTWREEKQKKPKEKKRKWPFQARENSSVSQFYSQERLGIKILFCMLNQLTAHAPELDVRS